MPSTTSKKEGREDEGPSDGDEEEPFASPPLLLLVIAAPAPSPRVSSASRIAPLAMPSSRAYCERKSAMAAADGGATPARAAAPLPALAMDVRRCATAAETAAAALAASVSTAVVVVAVEPRRVVAALPPLSSATAPKKALLKVVARLRVAVEAVPELAPPIEKVLAADAEAAAMVTVPFAPPLLCWLLLLLAPPRPWLFAPAIVAALSEIPLTGTRDSMIVVPWTLKAWIDTL